MSWQGYIENIKLQCKSADLQAVGIFGQNGNLWAAENCSLTPEEAAYIARHINEGDESICASGFTVGGEKFAVVLRRLKFWLASFKYSEYILSILIFDIFVKSSK